VHVGNLREEAGLAGSELDQHAARIAPAHHAVAPQVACFHLVERFRTGAQGGQGQGTGMAVVGMDEVLHAHGHHLLGSIVAEEVRALAVDQQQMAGGVEQGQRHRHGLEHLAEARLAGTESLQRMFLAGDVVGDEGQAAATVTSIGEVPRAPAQAAGRGRRRQGEGELEAFVTATHGHHACRQRRALGGRGQAQEELLPEHGGPRAAIELFQRRTPVQHMTGLVEHGHGQTGNGQHLTGLQVRGLQLGTQACLAGPAAGPVAGKETGNGRHHGKQEREQQRQRHEGAPSGRGIPPHCCCFRRLS
jgi:hypothetical protein